MSWAPSPQAAASGGVIRDVEGGRPGLPPGRTGAFGRQAPRVRSVSAVLSVAGAAVIWIALLGPVIALLTHLSWGEIVSAVTGPGNLDPLLVSLASGGVTLAVLLVFCTPLSYMLARGTLP